MYIRYLSNQKTGGVRMSDTRWLDEASEKIKKKMEKVAKRNKHKIPYTTVDGVYDDWTDININWWTNGFWGGMMWQLYHATKNPLYKEIAEENELKLDKNLMNPYGMDHDSGFKWLTTSGANYKMTGDRQSFERTFLAAENLAGRFNPAGRFIRAWNDSGDGATAGWAIIDCMMNLPLLYWAYEHTSDPRFYHIARLHAETVMKYFVREDYSVIHIGEFNPMTGEFIESKGGQGYAVGSSWTRGQAWAVYGFILSYIHTKEKIYLEYAKNIGRYFIDNIPESGLIPVDFRQPEECGLEDSTAAAIAACGFIEIARYVEADEQEYYHNAAIRLLKALYDNRCNFADDTDNIVERCTAAFHDEKHEFAIIYGDYYFIEAIWKLTGQELFIW